MMEAWNMQGHHTFPVWSCKEILFVRQDEASIKWHPALVHFPSSLPYWTDNIVPWVSRFFHSMELQISGWWVYGHFSDPLKSDRGEGATPRFNVFVYASSSCVFMSNGTCSHMKCILANMIAHWFSWVVHLLVHCLCIMWFEVESSSSILLANSKATDGCCLTILS